MIEYKEIKFRESIGLYPIKEEDIDMDLRETFGAAYLGIESFSQTSIVFKIDYDLKNTPVNNDE